MSFTWQRKYEYIYTIGLIRPNGRVLTTQWSEWSHGHPLTVAHPMVWKAVPPAQSSAATLTTASISRSSEPRYNLGPNADQCVSTTCRATSSRWSRQVIGVLHDAPFGYYAIFIVARQNTEYTLNQWSQTVGRVAAGDDNTYVSGPAYIGLSVICPLLVMVRLTHIEVNVHKLTARTV